MNIIIIIGYFIQLWIALYLLMPFFALLIYFFKKLTNSQYDIDKKAIVYQKDFDFAVVITVHKEVQLVPALIDSFLKQSYQSFTIYIVADACDSSSLQFSDKRIMVLKPDQDLNSKILSIRYAIERFIAPHDTLVIVDPDNLVHPNFLQTINRYFQKGFKAVQANLQPKNMDSVFARLDSMGDLFYNFVDREMRMEIGLSSAVWGSGIAVETSVYKEIVYQNTLGGFDKRIQSHIVQRMPQLGFAKEAIIYDEKITSGSSLQNQRTRWLHSYFRYFLLGWQLFVKGLRSLNFKLVFFGLFTLRPPLFILCLVASILCLLHYWFQSWLFIPWLAILTLFTVSFIIIVLIRSNNKKNIWSVFLMPVFIAYQFVALLRIRKAGKSFLKTEHSKLIYIEDLLGNESA